MNQQIDLTFLVPDDVWTGLQAGNFERVGGIIRETESKKVVFWLRDPAEQLPGGKNIVIGCTHWLRTQLTDTESREMHRQFDELKSRLDSIESKIDAQNMATLQAGFQLAADAEAMVDGSAGLRQLQSARGQLLQGSLVFQNLLRQEAWTVRKMDQREMGTFRLAVLGKLAIARTYMIAGERQLAAMHLEAIHGLLATACLSICKDAFRESLPWWGWVLVTPLIPPALVIMGIIHLFGGHPFDDSNKEKVAKFMRKLEAKRTKTEEALDKVLKEAKKKKLEIPPVLAELLTLRDFIRGFQIENEQGVRPKLLKAAVVNSSGEEAKP